MKLSDLCLSEDKPLNNYRVFNAFVNLDLFVSLDK